MTKNLSTPFTLAEMATPRGFEPPSYGVQFSEGDANLTGGEHAPDSDTVNCSPTPERTSELSTFGPGDLNVALFWSNMDHSGGEDACWTWSLFKDRLGYGRVQLNGASRGSRLAHRIAWELTYGAITKGLVVSHLCNNPSCCNPRHLSEVPHTENIAYRDSLNRQARGEQQGAAKLTAAMVIAARRLRAQKFPPSYRAIAERFGVNANTLEYAAKGKSWAWLKDEEEGLNHG